jgi:error-prone DNA polymerase
MRMRTAEQLKHTKHGTRVRATGIVTSRQKPGTKTGVVFLTLEDETGLINVVVWNHIVKRQRREVVNASLLCVEGVLERKDEVTHLVAKKLFDISAKLGKLATSSRDFH